MIFAKKIHCSEISTLLPLFTGTDRIRFSDRSKKAIRYSVNMVLKNGIL